MYGQPGPPNIENINPAIPMCPEHPHYPLDLMCKEDSCLPTHDEGTRHMACIICVDYGPHKGHRCNLITEVNSQVQQQLDELILSAKAASDILTHGSSAVEDVVQQIRGVGGKASKGGGTAQLTIAQIESHRDQLIARITEESTALVNEVSNLKDSKIEYLAKQQADISGGLSKLHLAIANAETLATLDPYNFVQEKDRVLAALNRAISVERPQREVLPVCSASFTFEPTPTEAVTLGRLS